MERLMELRALGYSPRQIGTILGVSHETIRRRLRERTNELPDPHFAELGRKGQKGRRRAMKRRKREAEEAAEAEAEAHETASVDATLKAIGLAALVAQPHLFPRAQGDDQT